MDKQDKRRLATIAVWCRRYSDESSAVDRGRRLRANLIDPDPRATSIALLDHIDRNGSVIFYPSGCRYSEEFQSLPYDAVVITANTTRRPRRIGKVYCLSLDNNELLGLLAARGIRLSALVIIRDGCAEGGNYECAARASFFSRVMPVMSEEFEYFTDHGYPPRQAPSVFSDTEVPIHLQAFVAKSDPLGPMRSFRVSAPATQEREFTLGRIRVKVIRDSIWRAVDLSDNMVVAGCRATPRYLRGRLGDPDPVSKVDTADWRSSVTSIEKYLRIAEERKLSRISFMPLANGAYAGIVHEIEEWTGELPRQISFYHLHAGDYCQIRSRG